MCEDTKTQQILAYKQQVRKSNSGVWRHVAWHNFTDISEEFNSSIFVVKHQHASIKLDAKSWRNAFLWDVSKYLPDSAASQCRR
jgi:hypothetical protein